jgi:hypothetical protein
MRATGIVPALQDAPLRDRDGLPVGAVEDLLFDPATNRPTWLVVRLAGGRRTVVPSAGSRSEVRGVRVSVCAEAVASCPVTLEPEAPLPVDDALRACNHYGIRRAPDPWAADTFVVSRGAAGAPPRVAVAA